MKKNFSKRFKKIIDTKMIKKNLPITDAITKVK